jgi:hypothetical protein
MNESIAGFIYLGTATNTPRQPTLLTVSDFVQQWSA